MKTQTLIISLVLTAGGAVFAQSAMAASTATPRVDRREARQQERINQGVASGQLTPRETAHLQAEQGRINVAEAKAKSDSVVTAKERAHLTHMQYKASRHIRRDKHNGQHI